MWYKRNYTKEDFSKVREFLIVSNVDYDVRCNWGIERLNFAFSVASIMNDGLDFLYKTIMLWEDDHQEIIAIVINEGEMQGEVFFQLRRQYITRELLIEMFDYAEETSYAEKDGQKFIQLMIPTPYRLLKELAIERGYIQSDWVDHQTIIRGNVKLNKPLAEGFRIADAREISVERSYKAHGLAWRYDEDKLQMQKAKKAFKAMRDMPDYSADTDILAIAPNDEIVAYATMWYDSTNKVGLLEPLGTSRNYRRLGLASHVLHEGIRRVNEKGAIKCYGGDKKFYYDIGFTNEVDWVPFEKIYN